MNISHHFELNEFLQSQYATRHGICMDPPPAVIGNLKALAMSVLDPLRESLGSSIYITSGFRPVQLNTKIGGSGTSQHVYGEAADIKAHAYRPIMVCQRIIDLRLPFDQLIYEFGNWTHVSHTRNGKNRGQVLTAKKIGGRTKYFEGLLP